MNQTTANYDEPWKEALTEYFEAFLCFFFPEVHQLISYQLSSHAKLITQIKN